MTTEGLISDLLACPRCDKTPLSLTNDKYSCIACKTEFPSIGGIPWLFAHPESSLSEWRNRLHFEIQSLTHDTQRISDELSNEDHSALTKERLELQLQANEQHRNSLRQILSPIDIQSSTSTYESYLALRTRLPTDQGLHTYYANIHRDWSWGEAENAASIEQIIKVANDSDGGQRLGDTLVLGAGGCRLAYDIHLQLDTQRTLAMDFNPLLMLIADSVIHGTDMQLYEFPIAPISTEYYAVERTLHAPQTIDGNFHLLLGDVLRPSFAAHSFDTVVTPWLIDIISEDFAVFAKRINQLLKPGGRWINFGSLAFDHPIRSRRYSPAEVIDIVQQTGFSEPTTHEACIPYMCSPASRHGRQELVFSFAASKQKDSQKPPRHNALPDWLVTGKEPVPALSTFRTQAMSTQIYAYIMSLIDGKRSIIDMADLLEQQQLMTRQEAEPAIRNFLTRMFDDSERQSQL